MLNLYIYGYLNRVQSSRRLERKAGRNFEMTWLTGRLAPDHKTKPTSARTMARDQKGLRAIRRVVPQDGAAGEGQRCHRGSKFKAVNSLDNNFTQAKIPRRYNQIEESVAAT